MLYSDLKHVNVGNKIEVYSTWEYFFLNLIIPVINGATFTKFETPLVKGHSEGTVSQNFDIGPSFYFMKSRKLSSKKL